MQAANISYGKGTTAVALDDGDDDDDEGGFEAVVQQHSRTENEELRKTMVIPGHVHAVSMQVQLDETAGASTVSGEWNWLPEMKTEYDSAPVSVVNQT